MPVFNHHEVVKVMVDSILGNSFQQWELILVDDGSDEKTCALLKNYSDNDKRIVLLKRNEDELKGAQTCRNKGLEYAKGEYVVFFDSDDFISPFCLQQRVEEMDRNPDVDFLVFPSAQFIDGRMDTKPDMKIFGYEVFEDDIEMFARRFLPFIVWNNIYRRKSLIERNVSWDTRLKSLQDSDFNLCCLLKGMRYKYITSQPDYAYRAATAYTSITSAIITDEHKNSHIYAIDKFYEKIRNQFHNKYDKALYYGALFIYNSVTAGRPDDDFGQRVARCVGKWDSKRGKKLERTIRFNSFLRRFMPNKYARRFAFFNYLMKYGKLNTYKIKRIQMLNNIHDYI
mgnify:CR=1 FL=1